MVFEQYPFSQDKELGIWTVPERDMIAWFRDPDGEMAARFARPGGVFYRAAVQPLKC